MEPNSNVPTVGVVQNHRQASDSLRPLLILRRPAPSLSRGDITNP